MRGVGIRERRNGRGAGGWYDKGKRGKRKFRVGWEIEGVADEIRIGVCRRLGVGHVS